METEFEKLFWSKIKKTNSCWLWLGRIQKNKSGRSSCYFSFTDDNGTQHNLSAAQLTFQFKNNYPVPKGFYVIRTCDTDNCVHPEHLKLMDHKEKYLYQLNLGAMPDPKIVFKEANQKKKNKKQCKRGHLFTAKNTSITKNGTRKCLKCEKQYSIDRWKKIREEKIKNGKFTIQRGSSHCKRGHEYSTENTRIVHHKDRSGSYRLCKKCLLIRRGK